jgi:hypothetical protein
MPFDDGREDGRKKPFNAAAKQSKMNLMNETKALQSVLNTQLKGKPLAAPLHTEEGREQDFMGQEALKRTQAGLPIAPSTAKTDWGEPPAEEDMAPESKTLLAKPSTTPEGKQQAEKAAMWMGHSIMDPKDAHKLELESAINEFHHKMPREEAEKVAFQKYKKTAHLEGAAHHLKSMKVARSIGAPEAAEEHYNRYAQHLQELGADPNGPVPSEISSLANKGVHMDVKEHPADRLMPLKKKNNIKVA